MSAAMEQIRTFSIRPAEYKNEYDPSYYQLYSAQHAVFVGDNHQV